MKRGVILFSATIGVAGLFTWEQLTRVPLDEPAPPLPGSVAEETSDPSLRATAPARSRLQESPRVDKPSPPSARPDATTPSAPETAPRVEFDVENLAWEG